MTRLNWRSIPRFGGMGMEAVICLICNKRVEVTDSLIKNLNEHRRECADPDEVSAVEAGYRVSWKLDVSAASASNPVEAAVQALLTLVGDQLDVYSSVLASKSSLIFDVEDASGAVVQVDLSESES